MIQPNGRVQRLSVAPWNPGHQPHLAPHAVLWAGWPRSSLQLGISDTTLNQLNEATAQWLATRTDGLASWLTQWPSTMANIPTEPPNEWIGLTGRRFEPEPSASNWGVIGLMQTPTARMRPAGSFGLSYQRTWPYSMLNVMLQPFDGLEAGFRYTNVANRLYGMESVSGAQGYKDKSFELKARVLDESRHLPAVAVGVRDLGGTGLFGSEYIVASKRWGRLDYSLGMAWGQLGGRQNLPNPLRIFSPRFDQRQNDIGQGGTVSTHAFFRGRTALFGGVEYQSPWGPVLKVEYDSNDYQHEPMGNNLSQKSPINLGLVYRAAPGLDLTVGRERGTTWSVGLTLYTDLSHLNTTKVTDQSTPPVALQRPPPSAKTPAQWAQTRQDIQNLTQWQVNQIQRQGDQLVLDLAQSDSPYHSPRIDKAMAVLHRDAPADIEHIELRHHAAGDVLAIDRIDRQAWVRPYTEPMRTTAAPTAVVNTYPEAHSVRPTHDAILLPHDPERYSLRPGINLSQSLGGPNAFLLYQLNLTMNGKLALPGDVVLSGGVNAGVFNNYNKFNYTGPSQLPRVRTYMREYLTASRLTLPNLYASRTTRLATAWTAAVYAGYLEEMYAGAGGELMYRLPGSRWAAGVDVNQVQQRHFAQNLALRDYKAITGHASLYWQTPWKNIDLTLSAGQYLAKDRGVTAKLSRTFSNGVTMGAFVTKTNVSAAQFGEGSFNKGVYWSIPFDAFMISSSREVAAFNWVPLTRDGGAILNRPLQLINATHLLDPRMQSQQPAFRPEAQRIPDDRSH